MLTLNFIKINNEINFNFENSINELEKNTELSIVYDSENQKKVKYSETHPIIWLLYSIYKKKNIKENLNFNEIQKNFEDNFKLKYKDDFKNFIARAAIGTCGNDVLEKRDVDLLNKYYKFLTILGKVIFTIDNEHYIPIDSNCEIKNFFRERYEVFYGEKLLQCLNGFRKKLGITETFPEGARLYCNPISITENDAEIFENSLENKKWPENFITKHKDQCVITSGEDEQSVIQAILTTSREFTDEVLRKNTELEEQLRQKPGLSTEEVGGVVPAVSQLENELTETKKLIEQQLNTAKEKEENLEKKILIYEQKLREKDQENLSLQEKNNAANYQVQEFTQKNNELRDELNNLTERNEILTNTIVGKDAEIEKLQKTNNVGDGRDNEGEGEGEGEDEGERDNEGEGEDEESEDDGGAGRRNRAGRGRKTSRGRGTGRGRGNGGNGNISKAGLLAMIKKANEEAKAQELELQRQLKITADAVREENEARKLLAEAMVGQLEAVEEKSQADDLRKQQEALLVESEASVSRLLEELKIVRSGSPPGSPVNDSEENKVLQQQLARQQDAARLAKVAEEKAEAEARKANEEARQAKESARLAEEDRLKAEEARLKAEQARLKAEQELIQALESTPPGSPNNLSSENAELKKQLAQQQAATRLSLAAEKTAETEASKAREEARQAMESARLAEEARLKAVEDLRQARVSTPPGSPVSSAAGSTTPGSPVSSSAGTSPVVGPGMTTILTKTFDRIVETNRRLKETLGLIVENQYNKEEQNRENALWRKALHEQINEEMSLEECVELLKAAKRRMHELRSEFTGGGKKK